LNVCGLWAKMLSDASRQPTQIARFFIEPILLLPRIPGPKAFLQMV
jgi:hypothetical protein